MDWKIFLTAFTAIFIAEIGDKTQLAVLGFSTKSNSVISIFLGAMCAFFVVTLIAVLFGEVITKYVPEKALHYGSATLFIIIGIWTFLTK